MKDIKSYLIVAVFILASIAVLSYKPPTTTTYVEHVVRSGETIWSIAGIYADKQILYIDEFIWTINKANPNKGKYIYPGQIIKIPLTVHATKK